MKTFEIKIFATFAILLIMAVTLFAAATGEDVNEAELPERAGRHLGDVMTDSVNWLLNQLG